SSSAQLGQIENRRQELSQAIVGLDESLSQARIPAEDLSAQLADLERSLAQMEGSHQNLKSVLDVRRDASGQITEQIEDRKQRLDAVENETSQLESLQKNERVQEQDISQELDEARKQIKPAEDQLSEAEEAINSRLEIEASLRRQVRTAEQDSSQAELSLHRQQDQLDHLRDRIAEELGLVDLPLEEDIDGQNPLPMGEIIGQLPFVKELPKGIEETIQVRRQQLRRMGLINPAAPREFHELSQRYEFLDQQMTDLEEASKKLKQVIDELDVVMEREFNRTFNAVATEFRAAFTRLFAGGSARLVLTDPDSPINSGVEIIARPPGRRQQGLALLSGGERSLTAAALIFALLKVSPTPFCVLDEVDAMLDEANISRFRDMLKELSENTQFIIITHNRGTVVAADTIYGVSMGDDGVSQVMSLRLEGEDIK
ncbi:MAG: AAA family ATPase, partial [Chloroflexota bacterium]